ncbi:MAG: hypothetical protein A2W22_04615 [Candidatus Levybacteria bacterium RBG_16_35_11]|nr:MAG: hypothetical protein A2W22_04615 [Candidatus Levybacteria bacterium RBG_16_35_11]
MFDYGKRQGVSMYEEPTTTSAMSYGAKRRWTKYFNGKIITVSFLQSCYNQEYPLERKIVLKLICLVTFFNKGFNHT